MVKSLSTNALDAALEYIASRANLMTLCAGAPTDAAEASSLVGAGGNALATLVLTDGGSNGFTLGDGVVSGRRVVVSAKAVVPIAETGIVDHVALVDTSAGELLVVTELTETQNVTAGEIISVKAFGGEIQAPA